MLRSQAWGSTLETVIEHQSKQEPVWRHDAFKTHC